MHVTIGIPFYNAEKYLLDAIRSVFAQTHKKWELILLDDGSSDRSLEIAKSVNDPRVRVISDGKNKKLAYRLNQIIQLATHDFIVRMDADDLMIPDRIKTQLNILLENPDLDLVSSGVYSSLNNLKLVGIRGQEVYIPSFNQVVKKQVSIVHASIIAKKNWYERNNYDEQLPIAQDYDLWLRASKKSDFKIKAISKPLYVYREEDNVTVNKLLRAYHLERQMYRKYVDEKQFPLLLKSYIKTSIVHLLSFLNLIKLLQQKRNNNLLNESSIKGYQTNIDLILSTKVPGLDGGQG